ncbi:MAG: tRNA preQ1(34) S-adenosylmethionine ribosyltransferase-isomerase QueA [Chloroflexi bacterium]|nr:tRNA preQ1(34) S-adenosylmethionine ribosyltransferase-isomerase QueA [Chloroflexota bacterium]
MLTSEFAYQLPEELIAQVAIEPRDAARMLVLQRATGQLEHRIFHDIGEYLRPGDLLVANETKVIPARLQARKIPSGGKVELLLLTRRDPRRWELLVKGRHALPGQKLEIADAEGHPVLAGAVESITAAGGRVVCFEEPLESYLTGLGKIPLPPYIHEPLRDPGRYQTVYAHQAGSVAAPTAGLHFTPELLHRLTSMGVGWATVTLHIGLDTFRPVREDRIEDHQIHTEYCHLERDVADRINRTKSTGGRIVAVGTTSVRVLETAAASGKVEPYDGFTGLYIYPGFTFHAVDALITNFHLPRSSLLMLVSAFAGMQYIRSAYETAVQQRYRFYSFGDAMLIL